MLVSTCTSSSVCSCYHNSFPASFYSCTGSLLLRYLYALFIIDLHLTLVECIPYYHSLIYYTLLSPMQCTVCCFHCRLYNYNYNIMVHAVDNYKNVCLLHSCMRNKSHNTFIQSDILCCFVHRNGKSITTCTHKYMYAQVMWHMRIN